MRRLAEMYRTGDGVPKDPVRGYMWADIVTSRDTAGTASGNLGARHAAGMTADQVAQGRRMAEQWRQDRRAVNTGQ